MVKIAVLAESSGDDRVALSPDIIKKYQNLGCELQIQSGAGNGSFFSDDDYKDAGVKIGASLEETVKGADIVLCVNRPDETQIAALSKGTILACIMEPFDNRAGLETIASAGVTTFAMEFMPRISRAQSMDVLSSQSNLAGYKAVVNAAGTFKRAMPMMMTAAGTVAPAKAFIMGVGVAGLQAIATAKRMGAIVSATDVRPATKEQVESLGGTFIAVENEEFKQAETAGGYAKQMSEDYQKQQAELVAGHIAKQDIVITTALIPGRDAPILITEDMVKSMPKGAIIVDLAAERGGNCALTQKDEIVQKHGVTIIGHTNLAGQLPVNASSLYSKNLYAFVETMIFAEESKLAIDWEDELIAGTLLTKDGKIVHERLTSDGS